MNKTDMKNFRSSSWHVSQGIEEQQKTLLEHIANSQETALNMSNELSTQKNLTQENNSWAQRLTNLLSGCVFDSALALETGTLSLPQLFVASGCYARGYSWQNMDYGQINIGYADAAREKHNSP